MKHFKNILKLNCFLLSLTTLVYGAETAVKDKDNKIMAEIQKSLGLGNTKITKVVKIADSQYTKRLLFASSESCPIVVKVFKGIKSYESELKQLEKLPIITKLYASLVNSLGESCDTDLPVLMEYHGAAKFTKEDNTQSGVAVLSEAKGKTLKDIIYDEIDNYDNEKIIKEFTSMGKQFGELDSLFYSKNKGEILIHPDSHEGNFMYDGQKLYWVDTAGLYMSNQYPKLTRFGFIKDGLNLEIMVLGYHIAGEKVSFLYDDIVKRVSKNSFAKNVNRLHKLILALRSVFEGYINQLKKNNIQAGPNIEAYYNGAPFGANKETLDPINLSIQKKNQQFSLNLEMIRMEEYALSSNNHFKPKVKVEPIVIVNESIPDSLTDFLTKFQLENTSIEDATELRLAGCELNEIPSWIKNFKSLEILNLEENDISEIPNTLSFDLPQLKELTLSDNKIKKLPESIGNFKNLIQLELKKNSLIEIPSSIGNLTQLEILDLRSNSFQYLPSSMKNLTSLSQLDLMGNKNLKEAGQGDLLGKKDLRTMFGTKAKVPK